MRDKLIELLGMDPAASDDDVLAFVRRLKQLANSPGARQERAITEKVASGLSRESAIQVMQDQAIDDEIRAERDLEAEEARQKAEAAKAAAAAKLAKAQTPAAATGTGNPPANP